MQGNRTRNIEHWQLIGEGPTPLWPGGHMRVEHVRMRGRMLNKHEVVDVVPLASLVGAVETIRQARDDLREALKIDANGNGAWLREQVQDAIEAFTAELGGR